MREGAIPKPSRLPASLEIKRVGGKGFVERSNIGGMFVAYVSEP